FTQGSNGCHNTFETFLGIREIGIFLTMSKIRMDTTSKLRKILNLKPGSTVIAKVVGEGRVLLEVNPTIEDLLKKTQESKA
ncbi:hypothetical protein, partial [Ferroglobus sp.]|uniref:hypothetical protein n=1 Tax=Ferroglobus sp. TaxID=2614230 RepID=UPI0025BDBB05